MCRQRKVKRGFGAVIREVIFCTGAGRRRQRRFYIRQSPIRSGVGDGALRCLLIGQLDEGEAAWPTRLTVGDDLDLCDLARTRLLKEVLNLLFFRTIRQITNIKTSSHSHFPFQRGIAHKAAQCRYLAHRTYLLESGKEQVMKIPLVCLAGAVDEGGFGDGEMALVFENLRSRSCARV